MKITVVIANYHYGHLASQAIESVLSQTRKPDRILFVDDESHEETTTLIRATSYPIDFLWRRENMGVVANFNDVLFNHVDTDFVLFLGADNWLRSDTLQMLEFAQKLGRAGYAPHADIISYDIALVGTEVEKFRKGLNTEYRDGYEIWKFQHGDIEQGNFIHGSSLYNVKLAREVGGYEANPKGKHTEEDWMLWRKMIRAGAKHFHVSVPLLYYRRHKANYNKI